MERTHARFGETEERQLQGRLTMSFESHPAKPTLIALSKEVHPQASSGLGVGRRGGLEAGERPPDSPGRTDGLGAGTRA